MVKRIINDPSAAALASYFDTRQEQLFLVFDFGGGTLDVSIVDCFDTMVEILQFPEIIISVEMILMKPLPVASERASIAAEISE